MDTDMESDQRTKGLEDPQADRSSLSSGLPDGLTLGGFVVMVIISGGFAVAIRFTLVELDPFWAAATRFSLVALIFWAITLLRRVTIPSGKALVGASLYGALAFGGVFILAYWSLTEISASLYQTVLALVPLLTLFFASLHGLESVGLRGIIGAILSLTGIAVVVGGAGSGEVSIPHVLAAVGAAACWAEAGVVAKKFPRTDPLSTNAVGMTVGSAMLIGVSLLSGESWTLPTLTATWAAFSYLIIATFLVFFLYLFVLGRWTASGTAYIFVLIPLSTFIVASSLTDEQITFSFIVGAVLVLAGVVIGALLPTKAEVTAASTEAAN